MGQLEHFLKNPGSGLYILPYERGRPGVGGRLNADNYGQGGRGGQKLAKFCGRLLWMAPKEFLIF